MLILIDSKHTDSMKKACIEADYQIQIHESDDTEIVHAYVMNGAHDLTQTQSFWLGVWFRNELSRELLEA